MPVTSTLLDQTHNAIERKPFAMKRFHHPEGSQQAFLTGLAHLYNLIPYQRRAQHAEQCGVESVVGRRGVQLFLDLFSPLTGPCQRCQPWADRVAYGCCWKLDESAGAAHVPRRLQPVLSFGAGGC